VVESLPLFPLGMVLFPGVLLPLHVFEERYRELMRALLAGEAENQVFGVVAIRQGWEVGKDTAGALHRIGCTAELRQVNTLPDGRYDVLCVGRRRFRLLGVDGATRPYLVGTVDWLPDEDAEAPADGPTVARAQALAGAVSTAFTAYLNAVAAARGIRGQPQPMPADPTALSHLVASAALLTLDDRQALLEQPGTVARLRATLALLQHETAMLRTLRLVPAPLSELPAPTHLN
jgi:Lon protease-like protein